MRVLTYTCPWPGNLVEKNEDKHVLVQHFANANSSLSFSLFYVTADHPKSDEYFSDPRLAAYAVPYSQAVPGYRISCPSSLLSSSLM